mmetsp:Transcript_63802/g.101109  ORF Transcript_63802/g.101109 Transcript_63802/m.101109 type:complete len:237 (-) Transcript_63802:62-772(-)|eukprot:CAMPEP_0169088728 /NCGR_PEP_ID=MMETSP1015-20121227/14908_1 /TAXON_ID=342587 /ORGANISM="Karlodinium micrum, Strain CCMP2283" /LENGTH=236 /DNA_ID=CAMNT_0009149021 /DNA_START=62 /DNA_END=772 /DNA_ORIENTATION=+
MFRLFGICLAVITHTAHAADAGICRAPFSCGCDPAPECVSGFYYRSAYYEGCTDADAYNTKWCSTTKHYSGLWKPCYQKKDCELKNKIGGIVGGVVAGGVAVTGIGLIAAAIHKSIEEENKKHQVEQNKYTTTLPNFANLPAAPAANAAGAVLPPAPVAAGGRLLAQTTDLRGSSETVAVIGSSSAPRAVISHDASHAMIIVLICVCICGIGSFFISRQRRKAKPAHVPDFYIQCE